MGSKIWRVKHEAPVRDTEVSLSKTRNNREQSVYLVCQGAWRVVYYLVKLGRKIKNKRGEGGEEEEKISLKKKETKFQCQ